MPRIEYTPKNFSTAIQRMIDQSNEIIADYEAQGFTLTLRQLFYQHVARGFIANKQTEYKRLGSIINDARLAGLIDWDAIEDRTRWLRSTDNDSGNPDTWLARAYRAFSKSRWQDQPYAVEVWVEKDALVGVVEAACDPLFVPYFACRGYVSQSELWTAAQRIGGYFNNDKVVLIVHLGDHDPSGIDMTRDIEERLELFLKGDDYGHMLDDMFEVHRIALNMDQVRQWNPPPNPAKLTDSRFAGYEAVHGNESWELDALDPTTLSNLITSTIRPLIATTAWNAAVKKEKEGQDRLKKVADNWDRVQAFLKRG